MGGGVGGAERRRRGRRQEEGLMVTVTVGGQLQLETYDRLTQSRTHTHTNTDTHLGNPSAPSHTQKDPWRGSD